MALAMKYQTIPEFFGNMNRLQKLVIKGVSTINARGLLEGLPVQPSYFDLAELLITSKGALALLLPDPTPPRPPSDKSRSKPEGLRANLAQGSPPGTPPPSKQPYRDPPQCLNPVCIDAGTHTKHRMRQCVQHCADPLCDNPNQHQTKQCNLLYGDGAGAYFQLATVSSSSSVRLHPSRSHIRRGHSSIRTLPIHGQRPILNNRTADISEVAVCPTSADVIPHPVRLDPSVKIQYDPGATHLFTPIPLDSDAPVIPYRDSLLVADGSSVPIIGKSMLGPVETYIAPKLTHALVPQAALESLGLLSILSAGELKLYDVSNKQSAQLLQLIARTQPACIIPFEDNQYIIPHSEFHKLIVTKKRFLLAFYHVPMGKCFV
jgi:hypothetical protein